MNLKKQPNIASLTSFAPTELSDPQTNIDYHGEEKYALGVYLLAQPLGTETCILNVADSWQHPTHPECVELTVTTSDIYC